MTIDYGYCHAYTARAGELGYYYKAPRGHASVYHDQSRYVYDVRGHRNPSAFRRWAKATWERRITDRPVKVVGTYPSYTIE